MYMYVDVGLIRINNAKFRENNIFLQSYLPAEAFSGGHAGMRVDGGRAFNFRWGGEEGHP